MRTKYLLLTLTSLVFLVSCTAQPQPSQQSQAPPDYKIDATIKDLMDSVVDPNADFIWESVATTVSAKGIEERQPHTDEEWKDVRRHAVALMEASNLLLMPGRHVAKPGERSEVPNIELEPEEIENLINQDRPSWQMLAHGLYDSVGPVLQAIDRKDAEGLLNTSDAIDRACENCHLKYWYPNEAKILKEQEGQQKKAEAQK